MGSATATAPDLAGWTVIALRSATQNAALAGSINATGADFVGLPALALAPLPAVIAAPALAAALACPQVIFTSPFAVRCAARLQPLADTGAMVFAVGAGTAAALQRAGIAEVQRPRERMNSEGLLALAALDPPAAAVGVVGAAGGRGLIQATLQSRGAQVRDAHVYRRSRGRIDRRHRERVLSVRSPLALLLTSGEALDGALAALGDQAGARLRQATVLAASERLAALAGARGFQQVVVVGSPRVPDLLAALHAHAKAGGIR